MAEEGFVEEERLLKEAHRCAAKNSWWKNNRKDEEGQKTAAQWGKEEEKLKEKAKALRLELKELTGSVYNLKRKRAGLKAAENKGAEKTKAEVPPPDEPLQPPQEPQSEPWEQPESSHHNAPSIQPNPIVSQLFTK